MNPDSSTIELNDGKVCIVDTDLLPVLLKFKWRAVKARHNWYAKTSFRKGDKIITLSMHRFIAKTRLPQVTHHKNFNSLDNRRSNLQSMSKNSHKALHQLNNIKITYRTVA